MKSVTMKKWRYALLIAVCFITGIATATEEIPQQGEGNRGDKIEALRIAFISQRLNLTPEEAQKFWPVYNAYTADFKTLRQNFKMGPDSPPLTAEQQLDFEQKRLDLKKKYKSRFEEVIGKEKVNTLYTLEEEFRQKLRELREQRQHNGGQGPPPGGPRGF